MFKVYFTNFGYFSANESDTLEGAKTVAKAAGFQAIVQDPQGNSICSWCASR